MVPEPLVQQFKKKKTLGLWGREWSQANSGYNIVIITTSTASDYRENSWVLRKLRPKT